ncbi:MAG: zinc ribbon domain-containing protein, partial [Promethearchaeota archaeon]
MPKYCTYCGNPLQSSWKVCPICGKSIYIPASSIITAEVSSGSPSSKEEPSISMRKEQKRFT